MARQLALYIEDTEIKLLVTSGNKVEQWASLMLDPGLVEQGTILDENGVAEAIKQLFKLQGLNETRVVVGISGLNSIFRIISIPEVSKKVLPEAVSNEANRVLPMPLSQVYYSYQPIPAPKGEMRLFLTAYPRNSTDILLSTIHKAGLKPHLMDLAPLALARCVNAPRAILVNAWLTFVDIVILSDRIPQVIRSLSLPVESSSLEDRLPSIAEELNRTITFYNSTYADMPLDASVPLFVCGNLAREPDSWRYLAKLGFSVSALKPPVEFKESFNPTQFMVNVGLALKGRLSGGEANQYSIIDFNALPDAYRPPTFSWTRVLLPVGVAVGVGLLGYGALLVMGVGNEASSLQVQSTDLKGQMVKLQTEIKSLKDSVAEKRKAADAFPAQAAALDEQVKAVKDIETFFDTNLTDLKQTLDKGDRDLREVVNLAPAGVNIIDIKYDATGTMLSGTAPSENLILAYGRALRNSGRFTSVIITTVETITRGEGGDIILLEFGMLLK